MKTPRYTLAALLALTALAAQAGESHDDARRLREAGDIQPLEQILRQAQKAHPGRTLEAELERKGERYIYEVKTVDAQGTVWKMKFDARSGELLKDRRDD